MANVKLKEFQWTLFFILAFWTHLHVYVMQRDIYTDMLCMQSKVCMIQNICVLFTTDDGMHEKHVLLLLLLLWSYLWNLTCPVSIHMYIPGILYTHILVSPCVSKHFFLSSISSIHFLVQNPSKHAFFLYFSVSFSRPSYISRTTSLIRTKTPIS